VTVYGDFATGYIITPTITPTLDRHRGPPPQPVVADDVSERLAHIAALLQQAQLELSEIRTQLG
jgi:hypothetical protein